MRKTKKYLFKNIMLLYNELILIKVEKILRNLSLI